MHFSNHGLYIIEDLLALAHIFYLVSHDIFINEANNSINRKSSYCSNN